jgi:hypothetical protein
MPAGGHRTPEPLGRRLRVALVWTVLMVAIAGVLAAQAMSSLYDAQQACFFDYPSVPCPASDDPAVARLTFSFVGVPLIWLVGIGLMLLAWEWQRRRGAPTG